MILRRRSVTVRGRLRRRKLTRASGDERVIICIRLAGHAQIEIVTRDRPVTAAALAQDAARGSPPLRAAPAAPAGTQPDAAALAAKASAENFPVALRLLPRRHRGHLMAVYNFARTVDDIGDEAPPELRLALLDDLDEDLSRLYSAPRRRPAPGQSAPAPGSARAGRGGDRLRDPGAALSGSHRRQPPGSGGDAIRDVR